MKHTSNTMILILKAKEDEQVAEDLKDFALSWHMAMCPTTTTTTTTTTTSREVAEGGLELLEDLEEMGNMTLLERMGGNSTEEDGGFFDGPPWSWIFSGSVHMEPLRVDFFICFPLLFFSLF